MVHVASNSVSECQQVCEIWPWLLDNASASTLWYSWMCLLWNPYSLQLRFKLCMFISLAVYHKFFLVLFEKHKNIIPALCYSAIPFSLQLHSYQCMFEFSYKLSSNTTVNDFILENKITEHTKHKHVLYSLNYWDFLQCEVYTMRVTDYENLCYCPFHGRNCWCRSCLLYIWKSGIYMAVFLPLYLLWKWFQKKMSKNVWNITKLYVFIFMLVFCIHPLCCHNSQCLRQKLGVDSWQFQSGNCLFVV